MQTVRQDKATNNQNTKLPAISKGSDRRSFLTTLSLSAVAFSSVADKSIPADEELNTLLEKMAEAESCSPAKKNTSLQPVTRILKKQISVRYKWGVLKYTPLGIEVAKLSISHTENRTTNPVNLINIDFKPEFGPVKPFVISLPADCTETRERINLNLKGFSSGKREEKSVSYFYPKRSDFKVQVLSAGSWKKQKPMKIKMQVKGDRKKKYPVLELAIPQGVTTETLDITCSIHSKKRQTDSVLIKVENFFLTQKREISDPNDPFANT